MFFESSHSTAPPPLHPSPHPLYTKHGKNNIGKVQYPILDNRYPIYMRRRIAHRGVDYYPLVTVIVDQPAL